jgi:hypothetical protein
MYNGKCVCVCVYNRHNTIKYLLPNKIISIDFVNSKKNIMDLLIKSLLRKLVYNSSKGMNLKLLKDKRV